MSSNRCFNSLRRGPRLVMFFDDEQVDDAGDAVRTGTGSSSDCSADTVTGSARLSLVLSSD